MARQTTKRTVSKARQLRREMSLPEVLLWRELKGTAGGMKFRKQHPVGPFVVEFYCATVKLAIEVDGIAHEMDDRPERDAMRDAFARDQGIETIRVPASQVLATPVDAAEAIGALCLERLA